MVKWFRRNRLHIGDIGQWLGLIIVAIALYSCWCKQFAPEAGLIAGGSIIFSIGTKCKGELKHVKRLKAKGNGCNSSKSRRVND